MYERCTKQALRIMEEARQGENPSILSICKRLQIAVKWIEGTHLPDGYAVVVKDKAYILLKKGRSAKECSDTLAHELAHILLGHVGNWQNIAGRNIPKVQQEKEAADFAKIILKAGK